MDGASRDQKLAAIMTPAANPIIASSNRRFTRRVKKTRAAPNAVTSQVKHPANNDWYTGDKRLNHSGTKDVTDTGSLSR